MKIPWHIVYAIAIICGPILFGACREATVSAQAIVEERLIGSVVVIGEIEYEASSNADVSVYGVDWLQVTWSDDEGNPCTAYTRDSVTVLPRYEAVIEGETL